MKVGIQKSGSLAIVTLDGQLDLPVCNVLREQFLPQIDGDKKNFVIDCAPLTYIGSAGLRVMYEALDKVEDKGGKMAFCRLKEEVQFVFDTVAMSNDCPIYGTLDDAIRSMNH